MTDMIWRPYGIAKPVEEYRFHPSRRYRFDYAFPDRRIAVEIEGGIWNRGAHGRGTGIIRDMEKYNLAASLGWRIFRFTPTQLKKGEAQTFMKEVLNGN